MARADTWASGTWLERRPPMSSNPDRISRWRSVARGIQTGEAESQMTTCC